MVFISRTSGQLGQSRQQLAGSFDGLGQISGGEAGEPQSVPFHLGQLEAMLFPSRIERQPQRWQDREQDQQHQTAAKFGSKER